MFNKYILASTLLPIIDFLYIWNINDLFKDMILNIQGSPMKLNTGSVILSYIFIMIVYNYFIVKDSRGVFDAFILGLCIYGIYEFTNKAIIKNWRTSAVILDTIWGGILFALTTLIYQKILY